MSDRVRFPNLPPNSLLKVSMHSVHTFIHTRPRLTTSILLGICSGFLFPSSIKILTHLLIAWNVLAWSYIFLLGSLMLKASHARVRKIAAQEDKGAITVMAILVIAACSSIVAIVLELNGVKDLPLIHKLSHYLLTLGTIFGSWFMIAMMFTFHYANSFYKSDYTCRPLKFPDDEQNPVYWDFLYFSFTIAVAAATSDVNVMSKSLRKIVLCQSILSFFFNVAILGLSINIAASLV